MRHSNPALPTDVRRPLTAAGTSEASGRPRPWRLRPTARLLAVPVALSLGLVLLPPAAHAVPAPAGPVPGVNATVAAAAAKGPRLVRIATFNVRTARATSDKRSWLQRAPDVASEIRSRKTHVALLQELGPGRADGKTGSLKGTARQTDSLTSTLKRQGAGYYKLVRNTSYFVSGTKHGTQGTRILYDSRIVKLVTRCPNTTGKRTYSTSCAFDLPIAAGDSKELLRSAAYAEFVDRRNGHHFFVVSAHLDSRHSKNNTTEARYNALRAAQARAVAAKLARVNPRNRPVIFGGDINSWRNDRGNFAPHRALRAKGYRDTASAKNRINYAYSTVNHFKTTMVKSKSKAGGVRLDVVLARNAKGVTRHENKMARVDASRPSDHNMVLADILL
jgi:endonuclease/exonuclease/phosphatase family metal-dependent hydrolase